MIFETLYVKISAGCVLCNVGLEIDEIFVGDRPLGPNPYTIKH